MDATDKIYPAFARLPNELLNRIFTDTVKEEMYVIPTKKYSTAKYQDKHKFPFLSKQSTAFGNSSKLGRVYQENLGDKIVFDAGEVYVNVKDLNFASLRVFLKELARRGQLSQFQWGEDGMMPPRGISIFHRTTRRFPDTLDKIFSFNKFVDGLEMKLDVPSNIDTYHEVVACDDRMAIERLICKVAGPDIVGNQFDLAFSALKKYHQGRLRQILTERAQREKERAECHRQLAAGELWDEAGASGRAAQGEDNGDEDLNDGEYDYANEEDIEDSAGGSIMENEEGMEQDEDVEMGEADDNGDPPSHSPPTRALPIPGYGTYYVA